MPEPPTFSEGGIQADAQMGDPSFGPKDSCWQCYKLFPRPQAVVCQVSQKKFCKQQCLGRYESDNIISCQLRADGRACNNKFVKSSGIFSVGKWLCCEGCLGDDSDIRSFNEMEERAAKM